MSGNYEPKSAFLRAIALDEEDVAGGLGSDENLRQVIAFMTDADVSNRDWATLLLSLHGGDSSEVREALMNAAQNDAEEIVRAEAVLGLAQRDPRLALPLVQKALRANSVSVPVFEAATLLADPSLIADLRAFTAPSGHSYLDHVAAEALEVCEAAHRPQ